MYVESCTILVVVNRLSRPVVVLDGLPSLYGFKYDSATACGLPLYLYSYKLVGSATFNHNAIVTAITHALVVVWSHYLAIDLQAIGAGFTEGMGEVEHQQLEDEVEDAAKQLASDIDLFGETDGDGEGR